MRQSFIIEKFDTEVEFNQTLGILDTIVIRNRDEGDILYESEDGVFDSLVKGRFVFNPQYQKYEPQFWFNMTLLKKLNWSIENGSSQNGLDSISTGRRTKKLLSGEPIQGNKTK